MTVVRGREGVWMVPGSGWSLAYRLWRPPSSPRCLVVLVHGFGEHGGRYEPLAQALTALGIAVAAPDLRGHGRSQGVRGDIDRFSRYAQDLQAFTDAVALPWAGQPRFAIFGHSFGGLVAIHWAARHPTALDRLIVQSPLIDVGFPVPRWKIRLGEWLSRWLPRTRLSINLDAAALTHDAAIVAAYRCDPLVHDRISARAYQALVVAEQEALASAPRLRVPTLLFCGEEDHVVSVAAARRWFKRLTCEKRLVSFPGAYHELHHESVREEVVRCAAEWLLP